MMTFYAAVGCYRIRNEEGHSVPYIQKLGKLHLLSIPEFVIWSTLLWEVMTYPELEKHYNEQIKELPAKTPGFDELLELMIKRKLIVKGVGYTGRDALYNMLSDAFVVPFRMRGGRKLLTALRLMAKGRISLSDVLAVMKEKPVTNAEDRVIRLVEQTPLSTSEIVRCFERGIEDVSTTAKVIAGIYPDSTQAEIASEEFMSEHTNEVLEAVSNLYFKRKIIIEVA